MDVLLDTNFILSCVKEKVDFLNADEFGTLILPEEVEIEIMKVEKEGTKKDREAASLALKIIEKNIGKIKMIELDNKDVDSGIVNYVRKNKIIVATLDKELRERIKGKAEILGIKGKSQIGFI